MNDKIHKLKEAEYVRWMADKNNQDAERLQSIIDYNVMIGKFEDPSMMLNINKGEDE